MPITTTLGDTIIGLSIAMVTSLVSAFGMNIQAAAAIPHHSDVPQNGLGLQDEYDDEMAAKQLEKPKCGPWLCLTTPQRKRVAGILIYLFGQPGNAIALIFAGPMILAPLGSAATLVFNAMFARLILGSRLSRQAAWGTTLLVIGGILCGVFIALASQDNVPATSEPLTHPLFLGWFGAQTAIVISLICLARFLEVTRVGLGNPVGTKQVKRSRLFRAAKSISVHSVKVFKYLSRPFIFIGKGIGKVNGRIRSKLCPGRIMLEESPVIIVEDKEISSPTIGLRTTSSGVWSIFQDLDIDQEASLLDKEEDDEVEALLSPDRPTTPLSPKIPSPIITEPVSRFKAPIGVLYALSGGWSASMAAALAKVTMDAIAHSLSQPNPPPDTLIISSWDTLRQNPAPLIALPILVSYLLVNLACLSKGLSLAGALLAVPVHMAAYIAPQLPDEAVVRGSSGRPGFPPGFLAGVLIGISCICLGVGVLGASESKEKELDVQLETDV